MQKPQPDLGRDPGPRRGAIFSTVQEVAGNKTSAFSLKKIMSNAAELYHDPLREDIDYLLERSRQHDRQLAEIRNDDQSQRQLEYLLERSQEHDRQLAELCDKWLFVTNSLGQQGRQIEGLTEGFRALERTASKLADEARAFADKRRPRGTRRSAALHWFVAGLAAILLFSGIWLFTEVVQAESPEPDAWIIPMALIIGSIVAALSSGALRG